uniref:Putative secreted protein n=1 Tax=Ixodes ricinus TaxID=34613 RepID=V5HLW1_IXORI
MKGFCFVLLPPFANVSGQIVTKLPVLTPLCYGYIHTATGARLDKEKKKFGNCRVWGVGNYVRFNST